jgi:hypothetical protein
MEEEWWKKEEKRERGREERKEEEIEEERRGGKGREAAQARGKQTEPEAAEGVKAAEGGGRSRGWELGQEERRTLIASRQSSTKANVTLAISVQV